MKIPSCVILICFVLNGFSAATDERKEVPRSEVPKTIVSSAEALAEGTQLKFFKYDRKPTQIRNGVIVTNTGVDRLSYWAAEGRVDDKLISWRFEMQNELKNGQTNLVVHSIIRHAYPITSQRTRTNPSPQ
jgi:hypothetical protein